MYYISNHSFIHPSVHQFVQTPRSIYTSLVSTSCTYLSHIRPSLHPSGRQSVSVFKAPRPSVRPTLFCGHVHLSIACVCWCVCIFVAIHITWLPQVYFMARCVRVPMCVCEREREVTVPVLALGVKRVRGILSLSNSSLRLSCILSGVQLRTNEMHLNLVSHQVLYNTTIHKVSSNSMVAGKPRFKSIYFIFPQMNTLKVRSVIMMLKQCTITS